MTCTRWPAVEAGSVMYGEGVLLLLLITDGSRRKLNLIFSTLAYTSLVNIEETGQHILKNVNSISSSPGSI